MSALAARWRSPGRRFRRTPRSHLLRGRLAFRGCLRSHVLSCVGGQIARCRERITAEYVGQIWCPGSAVIGHQNRQRMIWIVWFARAACRSRSSRRSNARAQEMQRVHFRISFAQACRRAASIGSSQSLHGTGRGSFSPRRCRPWKSLTTLPTRETPRRRDRRWRSRDRRIPAASRLCDGRSAS